MSRVRLTGPAEAVDGFLDECIRHDPDGSTLLTVAGCAPSGPAPTDSAAPAPGWMVRLWGDSCVEVPAAVCGAGAGFVELEVCTPLVAPVRWAVAVAELCGLSMELLWNDELSFAGRVLADPDGVTSWPMRSDALALHGWECAPWVGDPEPADVGTARVLCDFDPATAAALLRGHGNDDPWELVVLAAATLSVLLGTDDKFVDDVLSALERRDAFFASELRRLLAPLVELAGSQRPA